MVYENVLSSSFIYSLGAIAGKNSEPNEILQDSINFFQQTPTDQRIGDLLANWGGKNFIVEFKRTIGQVSEELGKEHKQLMTTELSANEEMKALSRRCPSGLSVR